MVLEKNRKALLCVCVGGGGRGGAIINVLMQAPLNH